jgi:hypothetical protein
MSTTIAQSSGRRARRDIDPNARIGDPERERTTARIGQALSQGYLSLDEYESRLGEALAAQTAGELDHVLADLPIDHIIRRDPRRRAARLAAVRRGVRIHLLCYIALSLLMVGIWLAFALVLDVWYPWPIWPTVAGGIGVVSHAIPVQLTVRKRASLLAARALSD